MKHLKTVEADDGTLRVVVVDSDGDPRENPITAQEFTISDLVNEMNEMEKYAPLFRSETPRGGGAAPSPRPVSVSPHKSNQRLSAQEKIVRGLNRGQATNTKK